MVDYKQLWDKVQEGRAKALPSYIDLKLIMDDMALVLEDLKEQAVSEFQDEYGGKEQQIHGVMVSKHSGGRYNYTKVHGWKQAKDRLTLIEEQAKLAYKAGGAVVDEETGEVTQPAEYIPNKESITIKLLSR